MLGISYSVRLGPFPLYVFFPRVPFPFGVSLLPAPSLLCVCAAPAGVSLLLPSILLFFYALDAPLHVCPSAPPVPFHAAFFGLPVPYPFSVFRFLWRLYPWSLREKA